MPRTPAPTQTGGRLEPRPRTLTPLQLSRRERILAVATDLLTREGYDAVTMRELARASGVALKTLYDVYGSKDELVVAAVKDRVARVYEEGARTAGRRTGVARLLYICEGGVTATIETETLSKGVASLVIGPVDQFGIGENVKKHMGPALEEIRAAGELAAWADADVLLYTLRGVAVGLLQLWAAGQIGDQEYRLLNRIHTAQTLALAVSGRSAADVAVIIQSAHRELCALSGKAGDKKTRPARRSAPSSAVARRASRST